MKYLSALLVCGITAGGFLISACKKSASEFNFSVGLTASFKGNTEQYLTPSGLVNTTSNYSISGYESTTGTNTIVLTIDSAISGVDSFNSGKGNSLVIVNNGVVYSSAYNAGPNVGVANITISGNKVTGTFSGLLRTNPSANPPIPKDSLVVTNGTINTTY